MTNSWCKVTNRPGAPCLSPYDRFSITRRLWEQMLRSRGAWRLKCLCDCCSCMISQKCSECETLTRPQLTVLVVQTNLHRSPWSSHAVHMGPLEVSSTAKGCRVFLVVYSSGVLVVDLLGLVFLWSQMFLWHFMIAMPCFWNVYLHNRITHLMYQKKSLRAVIVTHQKAWLAARRLVWCNADVTASADEVAKDKLWQEIKAKIELTVESIRKICLTASAGPGKSTALSSNASSVIRSWPMLAWCQASWRST